MALTGFKIPTLTEIINRTKTDINANIPGADSRVRRSVLGVLATMVAGAAKGLYDYIDFVSDQTNVLFAENENLDAWGSVWGVSRLPATAATGNVTFTGTDSTVVPAGTEIQRADGFKYTADVGGIVSGGSVTFAVTASEVGLDGNALNGVVVNLVSPIAGLDSAGTVDSITGGANTEADGAKGVSEAYRGRILNRIQQPPAGGAENDYVTWALEVPNVTRAFVFPLELGAGTVVLRFMTDDTTPDGIPAAGDVAAVQAYIDDPSRRPVTDQFTAVAPVPKVQNVEISNLVPDTPAVRAAIQAELEDMVKRLAVPSSGIALSKFSEAISIATGETSHTLVTPSADVTVNPGEIIVLGTVSFI